MENKVAQRYFKQVKRLLICDKDDRKRLLKQCEELMNTFQQENSEAEYDGFVAAFGTPTHCAIELISTLEESKVKDYQKKRLWIRRFTVSGIVIVLIFISFFWHIKYRQTIAFDDNAYVIVGPKTQVTEEEYIAATERIQK